MRVDTMPMLPHIRPLAAQNHESAHAVTACALGIEVVDASLRPSPRVRVVTNPAKYWEHLCVLLAGALGEQLELTWPPQRGAEGDEHGAALLVAHLALDESGWAHATDFVRELLALPWVGKARRAISWEMVEYGTVSGERVAELYWEALST